jgi:hypothetical protein
MLAPLLIESHAFLILQDGLRDRERFRCAHDQAPDRPARATFASPVRAVANRLITVVGWRTYARDHA